MRSPERIKYELENELACCAKCDYCYPTNGNPYGCEDRAYQIGIADDALEYIQQLEAAVPQWISVETPPEDDERYIVWDGNQVEIAEYWGDGEWANHRFGVMICGVTHYMPLPEPPKEE